MKTLFLVRHAESSAGGSALADLDRPLNDRGRRDAQMMGRRLARRDLMPDRLVSSPALRALATAQRFADELGVKHEDIVVNDRLYASCADTLLDVIRSLDAQVDCAMLFGHNPEFADLASRLSRQGIGMRPGAVAEFQFETEVWSVIGTIEPAEFVLDSPK